MTSTGRPAPRHLHPPPTDDSVKSRSSASLTSPPLSVHRLGTSKGFFFSWRRCWRYPRWWLVTVVAFTVLVSGFTTSLEATVSLLLPFHFRPLILCILGGWLWLLNIWVLRRAGIDVEALMQSPQLDSHRHFFRGSIWGEPIHKLVAKISWIVALEVFAFNLIRLLPKDTEHRNLYLNSCLFTSYLVVIMLLVLPTDKMQRKERFKFVRSLGRIVFGSISEDVCFSDVIIADILTSYSRVIAELFITGCWIQSPADEFVQLVTECSAQPLFFVAIALPYAWRLRQCIADVINSGFKNKVQMWNALKYSTMFPVIFFAYYTQTRGHTSMRPWWIFCGILNSLYSYVWDICFDWEMGNMNVKTDYFLLRNNINLRFNHFIPYFVNGDENDSYVQLSKRGSVDEIDSPKMDGSPSFYYFVLLMNFLLRFSWGLRLTLISWGYELNGVWSVFFLQIMEIFRRWMWINLRVERQWITQSSFTRFTSDVSLSSAD